MSGTSSRTTKTALHFDSITGTVDWHKVLQECYDTKQEWNAMSRNGTISQEKLKFAEQLVDA